jgi:Ca-activated chloride channel family protein
VAPNPLFSALQKATPELQAQAAQFLRSQQARGGTVLRPAMATAYKYGDPDRPLNVVILSDGMTEQQERAELLAAIQARPANARVFCIGVGNDVNRPLLSQIADDAGGLAAFISQGDDFQRQAEAFRRKLLRPAAANVKITLDGADAYDIEPQQLPNLYHGMPVRMYGRYRNAGTATVKVAAEINGAPLEQAVAIDLPSTGDANPEIERMWAWHKVDRLLKEADRNGSRSAVIDEIVRLGEGYSIVTEYTSFLVLENDAEYQRWQIDRRNLLRVGRDRQQQQLVRNELQRLREQALADLGPAETASETDLQLAVNPQRDVAASPSTPVSNSVPQPSGRDLEFRPTFQSGGGGGGGGIGGGAFDPITGGIALALAGLGFAARRRIPRIGERKERV